MYSARCSRSHKIRALIRSCTCSCSALSGSIRSTTSPKSSAEYIRSSRIRVCGIRSSLRRIRI
ncbi:hypothetical protein C0992_006483, partial [Termitomyces sp. T32_za158]